MNQSAPRRLLILVVVITVAVIANLVAVTLPVFMTQLGANRHMSESQTGLFAMGEMGGIALGSMLCALLPAMVARLTLRGTAVLGLVVLILANVLMFRVTPLAPFLLLSLVAGTGGGILNAVLYSVLLAEGGGARSVAYFNAAQLGAGALGVGIFSEIAARHGGDSLFLVLAGAGVLGLFLSVLIPLNVGHSEQHDPEAAHIASRPISPLGWVAVASLFTYFIGSGAVYSFLAYMGEAWGGKPQDVAAAISGIMAISVVATVLVAVIGSRLGFVIPLIFAIGGSMLAMALFILFKPVAGYLALGGLFYFCVNVATPYLFDALTTIDRSNSAAMMMGAAMQGGIALGPAVAGYLVTPDYVLVNSFALGVSALSGVMLVIAIRAHHRPALVPAT